MTDRTELIERITSGSGEDRELEADIAIELGAVRQFFESNGVEFDSFNVDDPDCFYDAATWGCGGYSYEAPRYLTSLDAIAAIPGANITDITQCEDGTFVAWHKDSNKKHHRGKAPTRPRAELAAVLREPTVGVKSDG